LIFLQHQEGYWELNEALAHVIGTICPWKPEKLIRIMKYVQSTPSNIPTNHPSNTTKQVFSKPKLKPEGKKEETESNNNNNIDIYHVPSSSYSSKLVVEPKTASLSLSEESRNLCENVWATCLATALLEKEYQLYYSDYPERTVNRAHEWLQKIFREAHLPTEENVNQFLWNLLDDAKKIIDHINKKSVK
jgi:hypothetical protein